MGPISAGEPGSPGATPLKGGEKKVRPPIFGLWWFAAAKYAVYGVIVFLIGLSVWSWLEYSHGGFSPSDTAFLAAEATLLLAAAAILVIVFEIEKARREHVRRSR